MNSKETLKKLSYKEKTLLKKLYNRSEMNQMELRKASKLKSANFYNTVDSLREKGLILVTSSESDKKRGRPSQLLKVNGEFGYYICMYFARFRAKITLMSFDRHEICVLEDFEINRSTQLSDFAEIVKRSYERVINELDISESKLIAYCIVSFSPIKCAMQEEGWSNASMERLVKDITSLDIVVDRIPSATMNGLYFGEYYDKTSSMLLLSVSDGISIAIIHDSKLLALRYPQPASIEHWVVNPAGRQCECGERGCVITSTGVRNIVSNVKEQLYLGRKSSLSSKADTLKFNDIALAAEQGDAIAIAAIEEAACVLTIAVKNLLSIIGTDYLVLTGRLIDSSPMFYNLMETKIKEYYPDIKIIKVLEQIKWLEMGIIYKAFIELLK